MKLHSNTKWGIVGFEAAGCGSFHKRPSITAVRVKNQDHIAWLTGRFIFWLGGPDN